MEVDSAKKPELDLSESSFLRTRSASDTTYDALDLLRASSHSAVVKENSPAQNADFGSNADGADAPSRAPDPAARLRDTANPNGDATVRAGDFAIRAVEAAAQFLAATEQHRNIFYAQQFGNRGITTGNGFGYAVIATNEAAISKLFAHPYRFDRPNGSHNDNGHKTTNFVDSIRWKAANDNFETSPKAEYLKESHIIRMTTDHSRQHFFMPFGLNRNALIAIREPSENRESEASTKVGDSASAAPAPSEKSFALTDKHGRHSGDVLASKSGSESCFQPVWQFKVEKEEVRKAAGREVHWIKFAGQKESVVLVPLTHDPKVQANRLVGANEDKDDEDEDKPSAKSASKCLPGQAWAVLSLESNKKQEMESAVRDLVGWQNKSEPNKLIQRELDRHEAWRKDPIVKFESEDEKKLWRQSETITRMAQIREENRPGRYNNGFINASLPNGEWFIPWVRDMAYAIVSMSEVGHTDEARKGLMAYFQAHPVGLEKSETRGQDYQISVVRYFGNGSEEADKSGEKTPNVELDNWGLALWAASEYYKKTGDVSLLKERTYRGNNVYESMRDYVMTPLEKNLDAFGNGKIVAADSSPWEEHQQNKRHFAYPTIAAIAGLRGFIPMAEAMNDKKSAQKARDLVADLERGFSSAFVRADGIHGSLEANHAHEIDGAVIEAFNMGVSDDPKVIDETLKKMELLREPSGGFRRVRGSTDYEKQEFLMIDFNMARLYFKQGRIDEGMKLLDSIVQRSLADYGQIPEMFVSRKNNEFPGDIGAPAGAVPMVGYGAAAYMYTLIARERAKQAKANATSPAGARTQP